LAPFDRAAGPREALDALDSLLGRWSPVIAAVGGRVPAATIDLVRTGLALTQLVDAAIESRDAPTDPPAASPPPYWRPGLALGAASIGLAALARAHDDLTRPRDPRRNRTGSSRTTDEDRSPAW
jgi:hypothetical protein